ncbi:MAG: hypothetical protein LBC52_04095 [Treponema sp.]|jgi:hypothetical protein|nr:hypothetical protein [Treponema sp.]
MKKVILGVICLLLITTCGFEIPKSLTVKGSPGLYILLGSPFAGMKEEDRLENLISPDNVKEMLDGNSAEAGIGKDLKIYEASRDLALALGIGSKEAEVQTYLARYPLADMPLDLKKYTDKAMAAVNERQQFTIPDLSHLPSSPSPSNVIYLIEDEGYTKDEQDPDNPPPNNKPFIKIALADMARLVQWVQAEGVFGLEVDFDQELKDHLELRIPGLGIPWMHGVSYTDPVKGPKLRYFSVDKQMFYPRDQVVEQGKPPIYSDLKDGNLEIFARISGPLPPKTYEPSLIFEWKNAAIDTVNATEEKGSFTGSYPIKNNLSKFLGKGVSFKNIEGYVYMSGGKIQNSTMSIGFYNSSDGLLHYEEHFLKNVPPLVFPEDDEEFDIIKGNVLIDKTLNSFEDGIPLKMKDILNAKSNTLEVAVQINTMIIDKDDIEVKDKGIKFDLLILVPFDLEVANEIPADIPVSDDIRNKYVMLDLEALNKEGIGLEGDLFGRKEGGNNALKDIMYVEIGLSFSKSDINIINPKGLAVLVMTNNKSKLMEFMNNKRLRFIGDDDGLNNIPFNPDFHVLLEKDKNTNGQYKDFGSFQILRPTYPSFDFKLFVEARTNLQYTLDL